MHTYKSSHSQGFMQYWNNNTTTESMASTTHSKHQDQARKQGEQK